MQYSNIQSPFHVPFPSTYHMGAWNSHYYQQVRGSMDQKPKKNYGHVHPHYGLTTIQDEHAHMHPGVTSTPIETAEGHVHKIWGNTTFEDGHIHYYEAYTGPPISLPNGYHTHYAEVKTTEDDGHIHVIKGYVKAVKG